MTECERSVSGGVVGAWGRWGGGNPVVSRCSTTGYRSAPLWIVVAGEGERTVLTGLTGLTEWTGAHGRERMDGMDGMDGMACWEMAGWERGLAGALRAQGER
jgi:hypothetical protein